MSSDYIKMGEYLEVSFTVNMIWQISNIYPVLFSTSRAHYYHKGELHNGVCTTDTAFTRHPRLYHWNSIIGPIGFPKDTIHNVLCLVFGLINTRGICAINTRQHSQGILHC